MDSQVTTLGHSAGAQLWAMVLLHRARQASKHSRGDRHRKGAVASDADQNGAVVDCRMPVRFIGGHPVDFLEVITQPETQYKRPSSGHCRHKCCTYIYLCRYLKWTCASV